MLENYTHLNFVIKEELNKERNTMQEAIKRVLEKFLLENQTDRVSIDKNNKIIKIDLNEKEECIITYDTVMCINIIKEYSKEKVILKTAELKNK